MTRFGITPMSTQWPSKEPGKPGCKECHGSGIRPAWVVDGWSFTDCLCKYGWTVSAEGRWQEPKANGEPS